MWCFSNGHKFLRVAYSGGFFSFLIQRIRLIRNKFSNKFLAFCKIVLFEKFFFAVFFLPRPYPGFVVAASTFTISVTFWIYFAHIAVVVVCWRSFCFVSSFICDWSEAISDPPDVGPLLFFFLLLLKSFKILQGFEIRIK